MVAGALTRKQREDRVARWWRKEERFGGGVSQCRRPMNADRILAQQNYQMSRFLLCYLVYSFLHACFLLGRFIFLRSRQARWTEGFTLVFMVSKKLLPLFIFHIAPRVMNNSGYMFCLVFQEGPFCFSRGGPPFVSSSFPTLSRLFSKELHLSWAILDAFSL